MNYPPTSRTAPGTTEYAPDAVSSYGLATTSVEPLLFKGDDFSKTDVVNALAQP